MEYRKFTKTGEKISLLGLGAMRLPLLASGAIDEDQAITMIRTAIDAGVNYVDTAYIYNGGKSEILVGKALKDGYREKVLLADKMPIWLAKTEEEMKAIFEKQFVRLGVDCIDMYLVHNVNAGIWKVAQKHGLLAYLEEQKTLGRIKHIGFSFHDELPLFKEVMDSYPWDFCQIQLNYMDTNFQAGVAGLEYAAEKNIPVIVMEPLKGGKLTDSVPDSIKALWETADVKRTPAEWAFKWVANFPSVLTILSGMSTLPQVEDNLRIFENLKPNSLTEKEAEIIEKVAAKYHELIQYSCTDCKYCMPCPAKINIPGVISFYNDWFLYGKNPKIKYDYNLWFPADRRASACTDCKACESHCPQSLPISDIMKLAVLEFE